MKCFISVFPHWLYSLNCFPICWLIVNDNLAGFRITTKAHLWLCLHGSFQKSLTEKIPPELGGGIVPWAGGPVWMKPRKRPKLWHSSRSFLTVKTMWPSYRTLPPPWKPWIVSSNGQPKIKSSSIKLLLGHKNKKHNYYIFLLPLLSITIPFWGLSDQDLVSPWSQPFFGFRTLVTAQD